jgi:tyrosyl-tRNA synthetase
MEKWQGAELNRAKEILAYELTTMVHGKEEAEKAQATARALFSAAGAAGGMPETVLSTGDLTDGTADILTLLIKTGLCSSKSDARRNIQQGGVTADDEKVTDPGRSFSAAELSDGIVLRRGKKNYHRVILK